MGNELSPDTRIAAAILFDQWYFNFQAKKALKNILQKCVHLPALEPLLHDAPPNILKHVVAQFSKVAYLSFLRVVNLGNLIKF